MATTIYGVKFTKFSMSGKSANAHFTSFFRNYDDAKSHIERVYDDFTHHINGQSEWWSTDNVMVSIREEFLF